jgi:putative salt-induced outer membrane protein
MRIMLASVLLPMSAGAAELPPNARDLLREAYPKERQTIVNVLRRLHPNSTTEISDLVRDLEQQNKEKVEHLGVIEGLRGEVAVGGFYSTGNSKEWGVTGSAALRREGKRWVNSLDLVGDRKSEDGHKVTDRLAATYRLRRNLVRSNWFVTGGLRYDRDTFAGFSRRFGQFVGLGYQLSNNRRFKWDVMAGPGLRQTRFIEAADENQLGVYARTSFIWQLNDALKFTEDLSASFGNGNNTYLSTLSLTSDVHRGFALRLSTTTEIETQPPSNRKKVDTQSRASVVYVFQPR